MDAIRETIQAMMCQEEKSYVTYDYLKYHRESEATKVPIMISANCRYKMVQWCNQCQIYCKLSPETIEVAISILDRFLKTEVGLEALQNQYIFQLATMAALYTAVKINEPVIMSAKIISDLSSGIYSIKEVEMMESEIIEAVQWKLNPPTALAFVSQFLQLIQLNTTAADVNNKATQAMIYDICKIQSEFAVKDYSLVPIKASDIAYSFLLNAVDSLRIPITYVEPITVLMDDTHSSTHRFVRSQLHNSISETSSEIPVTAEISNTNITPNRTIDYHQVTNHRFSRQPSVCVEALRLLEVFGLKHCLEEIISSFLNLLHSG